MKPASPLNKAEILGGALILIMLIGLWLPRQKSAATVDPQAAQKLASDAATVPRGSDPMAQLRPRKKSTELSADEIVAKKLALFQKKRRLLVHGIADYRKVPVPPEVEKFFDLMEAGDWDAVKAQFHDIATRAGRYDYSTTNDPALAPFWRPVVEAYGAAEQVHMWPAQQLLDYGNSIINSLQPGMVYVGGTDTGCFIPAMLNETGDGEQHVMLTQNALADSDYIGYLQFLYGGQINTLTSDQNQQAFSQYLANAPDQPGGGKPTAVSGVNAVMAINGILLQDLVQQNPDLSFAMEESFPIPSTYTGAAPLGPIIELGADNGGSAITSDVAQQSVDYWEAAAQNLTASSDSPPSDAELKTYAHDAAAAANLLANNNYPAAAEQNYETALTLWPDDLGTVASYAGFLYSQGRPDEATDLLNVFAQNNPGQAAAVNALRK
jgi:tetratricopeptide (TPR) repeat protein